MFEGERTEREREREREGERERCMHRQVIDQWNEDGLCKKFAFETVLLAMFHRHCQTTPLPFSVLQIGIVFHQLATSFIPQTFQMCYFSGFS